MTVFEALLIGIGIGIVFGLIYAEIQNRLTCEYYIEQLERRDRQIKNAFNKFMR